MDSIWAVVLAIAPSIGIGFLFYKVLRALLEGDRNERLAHAQWDVHHSEESDFAAQDRPARRPDAQVRSDAGAGR